MKKAAEDLKQQQLLKEQERQRVLNERIIKLPDVDSINNQAELEKIAQDFYTKVTQLEELKYDLEYSVRQKDFEINELTIQVNDLRGKLFAKLQKKQEQTVNFRENLRQVKTDKWNLEQLKKEGKKEEKKPESEAPPAAATPAEE
ncbi:unnamed protein product [Soboliphyme baturini]|uniref:Troponin I n=1 Tax=Soboliphyme baturini TaxID=241478 RepID=A0A183IS63_9BILA|nr:unnamed protein product [Soboliphyme baturini]